MIYNMFIPELEPFKVQNKAIKPELENVFGRWYKYYIIVEMCGNDIYVEEISTQEYFQKYLNESSIYWNFNIIGEYNASK